MLEAWAILERPDAWHLEEARHRLRSGAGGGGPGGGAVPGPLGAALARLRAAWDAKALAEADAVWDALVLPVERLGQCDAGRVAARATVAQAARLCLSPRRSARTAFADWFRRCGVTAGPRHASRTWTGRRLGGGPNT